MAVTRFRLYGGEDPRNLPAYTYAEAALYSGVPLNTLRTWISGRTYPTGAGKKFWKPIIVKPDVNERMVSFTNLVEAHVLNAIRRKHDIPMRRVRSALDFLSKEFESEHPLADYDFYTYGLDLFVEKLGEFINVSQQGQLAMREIIDVYLQRIERDERGLAQQLYPFTRLASNGHRDDPRIVVIDPRVAFGRPVIVGTGIPTAVVAERYKTGESIRAIADDYNRKVIEIEEAIRCEFELKAA